MRGVLSGAITTLGFCDAPALLLTPPPAAEPLPISTQAEPFQRRT